MGPSEWARMAGIHNDEYFNAGYLNAKYINAGDLPDDAQWHPSTYR